MGIDLYASHRKMTVSEAANQRNIAGGVVGYLREAYHGGPYATRILCPEAFEESNLLPKYEDRLATGSDDDEPIFHGAPIPGELLLDRIETACLAALTREAELRGSAEARALLAEVGIETKAPHTFESELHIPDDCPDPDEMLRQKSMEIIANMTAFVEGKAEQVGTPTRPFTREWMERASEFVEVREVAHFVAYCLVHEAMTGEPCRIYASY